MNEKLKTDIIEILELFKFVLDKVIAHERSGFKERYMAKSNIKQINNILEELNKK